MRSRSGYCWAPGQETDQFKHPSMPESGIGFGYILNRFGGYMLNDPREVALRQAVMKAVA